MPPDATKPPLQCQLQPHTVGQWAGGWHSVCVCVCVWGGGGGGGGGQIKRISFTWLPVLREGQSTLSLAEIPQLHCAIT